MRPDLHPDIEARAIDWMIRQRDPSFAEWDAFADWLAEDPGHADAYDAIASLDADFNSRQEGSSATVPTETSTW